MSAFHGAIDGWKGSGDDESPADLKAVYDDLWSLYDGSAWSDLAKRNKFLSSQPRVYRNTRLLYSHATIVGDFYASHVYLGALASDGMRLPDGSPGAIPIDPQTGDDATDQQLRDAIAHSWSRWNWQDGMTIRPLYCSVLGDGLTELIPDPERHTVWPQWMWPGYVVDLQLDQVDNVKGYILEYPVTQVRNGKSESFRFRKEVTQEAYRFWKNDTPWSDNDEGGHGDAEQENPYGFVPAIWDRHKRSPRTFRGLSAIANTRQALIELNSILSHGMDFQRKAFGAPVLIKGGMKGAAKQVVGPERDDDASKLAETLTFKEVANDGGVEQLQFRIDHTLEALEWTKQGILEANPEADFYNQLRQMTTLTGVAAERALGDAVGRVTLARARYDTQSVKLFQMAVAMCGHAAGAGWWGTLDERDRVYQPFGLDSYKSGQLDLVILPRPVVPETRAEQIAYVAALERLLTEKAFAELGYDEDQQAEWITALRDAADLATERSARAFASGI
jgi:hypothetical protein